MTTPAARYYSTIELALVLDDEDEAVSVVYLSIRCIVLLFIRAPFYVLLVFVGICSVFWLFWLSYQYLPSDWLERPL